MIYLLGVKENTRLMIKAKSIISKLEESGLTVDQQKIEKIVTDTLISVINEITKMDKWQYKFINDYKRDFSNNINGMIISIRRIPPSSVPNLFEQFDLKFDFDFKDKCVMYYQYGRNSGEIKKKEFMSNLSNVRQDLLRFGKQVYFDSSGVPNLDKVIDIKKLV